MTKEEYEYRMKHTVTTSEFNKANEAYMQAGAIDKDTFCREWKQFHLYDSFVVDALTIKAKQSEKRLNDLKADVLEQSKHAADFFLRQAEDIRVQASRLMSPELHKIADRLDNQAASLLGDSSYLLRKMELNYKFSEADKKRLTYILEREN